MTGWDTAARPTGPTLGQIAYEAYLGFSDGKSLVTGEPLPTWHNQDGTRQEAWEEAARAVARADREARTS